MHIERRCDCELPRQSCRFGTYNISNSNYNNNNNNNNTNSSSNNSNNNNNNNYNNYTTNNNQHRADELWGRVWASAYTWGSVRG